MKNPAVKRHIKLYIKKGVKFWGTFTLCLIIFTFIWYLIIENFSTAIYMSLMFFIVMLVIVIIPFGIAGLINISNFKKLIRYQEKKYNITFDDNDFKKIQINIGGEPKKYLYYNNNWFVISGEIAFYYKEIQKSKRKRINRGRYGHTFLHYITLTNNKVYKFRGNYKYYIKFKEWLNRENMVSK